MYIPNHCCKTEIKLGAKIGIRNSRAEEELKETAAAPRRKLIFLTSSSLPMRGRRRRQYPLRDPHLPLLDHLTSSNRAPACPPRPALPRHWEPSSAYRLSHSQRRHRVRVTMHEQRSLLWFWVTYHAIVSWIQSTNDYKSWYEEKTKKMKNHLWTMQPAPISRLARIAWLDDAVLTCKETKKILVKPYE